MTNVTTHALTNFVRSGDPNGDARSFWRPVERRSAERPSFLSFQAPAVRILTGYSQDATDFWLNQTTDSV